MGFEISGVELLIQQLDTRAKEADERAERAIKKGGQFIAELLRRNVPCHMGHLQQSIKAGPVKFSAGDGYHCIVRPVGNDPETGEPLAKIGNIVEYGHGDVPANPWMRNTLELYGDAAKDVIKQEYEREG